MNWNDKELTYTLTYKDVVDILQIIDDFKCQELRLELGDLKLTVIRATDGSSVVAEESSQVIPESPHTKRDPNVNKGKAEGATFEGRPLLEKKPNFPDTTLSEAEEEILDGIPLRAPIAGTFYRAPAPGAPPFVEVGTVVTEDDTVCIIEVMKLMNTIKASHKGVIRKIYIENETMVNFGQILMIIEPLDEASVN